MLSTLLGSETRARLLKLLLAKPTRSYHMRELIRLSGSGASGVQRDVERLETLGLVRSERTSDGRRTVGVVDEHELLEPLRALIEADAVGSAEISTPRLHRRVQRHLPAMLAALRAAGAQRAVVFGSATQPGPNVAPGDLDVLVRLGEPVAGRATRYFALRRALERASGLPVDLVEEEAVDNPYLRDEIERTGLVILEAA